MFHLAAFFCEGRILDTGYWILVVSMLQGYWILDAGQLKLPHRRMLLGAEPVIASIRIIKSEAAITTTPVLPSSSIQYP
jgi:hypothetical protein|tara:strand:+ start:282 stop:518 length:237 start_codon:yes stop_codon:yes gene_type:complete